MEGESIPFGLWLKRQRRALDLTQEELAQQIGCALVTLRKIETGERRPSKPILERLAVILSLPPGRAAGIHGLCARGLPWRRPVRTPRPHRHPLTAPPGEHRSVPSAQTICRSNSPASSAASGDGRSPAAAGRNAPADADRAPAARARRGWRCRWPAGCCPSFADGVWWVELASLDGSGAGAAGGGDRRWACATKRSDRCWISWATICAGSGCCWCWTTAST